MRREFREDVVCSCLMLNGPQYKFAAGVAAGLSAWEAYREAYPEAGTESAQGSASKLMTIS